MQYLHVHIKGSAHPTHKARGILQMSRIQAAARFSFRKSSWKAKPLEWRRRRSDTAAQYIRILRKQRYTSPLYTNFSAWGKQNANHLPHSSQPVLYIYTIYNEKTDLYRWKRREIGNEIFLCSHRENWVEQFRIVRFTIIVVPQSKRSIFACGNRYTPIGVRYIYLR